MTEKDLIESGDLEAYVCGVLSEEESAVISESIRGNKLLREEVERIENCYMKIAQGVAPQGNEHNVFDRLLKVIDASETNETANSSKFKFVGWAAAIALLLSSAYLYTSLNDSNQLNTELQQQITQTEQTNEILNNEIKDVNDLNADFSDALTFIKDKNTKKVILGGQKGFENSSSIAFHNAVEKVTYLDVSGLPEAPADKSYQLWSLTLNPLTPTSLGVVDNSEVMLRINNAFETQAFGITLEPKGGSPTPNLEQLYTLGIIN
jgi:anti-sigma-K factor RskA